MSLDVPAQLGSDSASLSRRRFVALSATAATIPAVGSVAFPSAAAAAPAPPSAPPAVEPVDPASAGRVELAYGYLDAVMDGYQRGNGLRLLQSYPNESALLSTAFVEDNALAAIAYLAHPTAEHVRRAMLIGDTFLWIQANDERFGDGRIREAYAAGPMAFHGKGPYFPGVVRDDGRAAFLWPFGFAGSSVGDAAWVGLALVRLYASTGQRRYLTGAAALGTWIATVNTSPYRYGGYLGGVAPDGVTRARWADTGHNIACFALFDALAGLTSNGSWADRRAVAGDFVRAMGDSARGYFAAGTQGAASGEDPDAVDTAWVPDDVAALSYLVFGERGADLAWARGHVARTTGRFSGGGHTVGRTRDLRGGRLNPNPGGTVTGSPLPPGGVVAATRTADHGYGAPDAALPHVGATSWFLIAALGVNPFRS